MSEREDCAARLAKYQFRAARQGEISERQAPIDPEVERESA
jgi:hypothetical protein